jgi:hypothetical protein
MQSELMDFRNASNDGNQRKRPKKCEKEGRKETAGTNKEGD